MNEPIEQSPAAQLLALADLYEKDGEPGARGYNFWGWRTVAEELRKVAGEIKEGSRPFSAERDAALAEVCRLAAEVEALRAVESQHVPERDHLKAALERLLEHASPISPSLVNPSLISDAALEAIRFAKAAVGGEVQPSIPGPLDLSEPEDW